MQHVAYASALLLLLALGGLLWADAKPPPKELGDVRWERDFDKALAASKTSGKPVLLFFQEVPG